MLTPSFEPVGKDGRSEPIRAWQGWPNRRPHELKGNRLSGGVVGRAIRKGYMKRLEKVDQGSSERWYIEFRRGQRPASFRWRKESSMRCAASFHLFFPVCAALLGGCGSDGNDTAASDEMSEMRSVGGSGEPRQAGQRAAEVAGRRAAAAARVVILHRAAGTPRGGGGGGGAIGDSLIVDAGGADAASSGAGGSGAIHEAEIRPPFDWVGIIGTGQSLSTGCGTAAVSTTQPFHNLKLFDSKALDLRKYPHRRLDLGQVVGHSAGRAHPDRHLGIHRRRISETTSAKEQRRVRRDSPTREWPTHSLPSGRRVGKVATT